MTEFGGEIFPDRHADLTVGLLEAMKKSLGEEALLRIVEVRAKDQVTLYKKSVPAGGSLKKRLEALAAQRSAEGYMAEVVQENPGGTCSSSITARFAMPRNVARDCVGRSLMFSKRLWAGG